MVDNLQELQELFIIAKLLKIRSLYDLLAACIACFFKSRSDVDLNNAIQKLPKQQMGNQYVTQQQQQPPQQQPTVQLP